MKILFTGSSSFTGYHFINELANNGHEIIVTFSKNKNFYLKQKNNRSIRVKKLIKRFDCQFNLSFSKSSSIKFIRNLSKIDIFCHHFADTKNYKLNDYDIYSALKNNTKNISNCIQLLKDKGLKHYIYTGSYFEPKEEFTRDYSSFSLYGVTKSLTGQIIRHYCYKNNVSYKKFVIPNPFGELEDENRILSIVADQWVKKKVFTIKHPEYLRDNVPIIILSKCYSYFVLKKNIKIFSPSFYQLSNLNFISRFSNEVKKRSEFKCEFKYLDDSYYHEPKKKYNYHQIKPSHYGLSSKQIWDDLVKYYLKI